MKKNILSQQLGALVETVPFNKSGFQNKIQPNLYQLKDQQLSKSKIFQSKSVVDNKDQQYFGSFFKIQQNEDKSEIDSTYIDQIFALKSKNVVGRSRVAMMAHSEGAGPETQGKFMSGFGKKSLLTLMIASVFMFAMPDDALAARSGGRSGGRMGGRAPTMSRPAAPRSAPSGGSARPAMRTSQPQVRNTYNRGPTVIMGSPFGYPGMMGGMGYGGFGYSPFGYNPALSLGFTFAEVLIRENQRQQYLQQQLETQRQLGQDQAAIQQLQRELSAQNQRVATINQQAQTNPNGKYDENVQKQIEAKVDSNMAALQAEFKKDMDSGDFTAAQKVKEQAQQLMLAN